MNKFVVLPFRLTALAALGLAATVAYAQPMVNARVVSSRPVVEQVPTPGCGPYGAPPTTGAGAAVGAVTGGLIGSQIGRGDGHIAGAILGAIGGAVLGNNAEAAQSYYQGGCAPRYSQRVTGYDVVYEYGGRQYYTRMAQPPGQWLPIPAPDAYDQPPPQPAYGNPEPPPEGYPDDAQSYPMQPPPPGAAYPDPSYPGPAYPAAGNPGGVVTAPPPAAYPPPAYPPQSYPYAYPPAPVYVQPPPPGYVAPPAGVNLSVGGMVGRRTGVGIGVGF
jgi:uncharacterized protein YcfJ